MCALEGFHLNALWLSDRTSSASKDPLFRASRTLTCPAAYLSHCIAAVTSGCRLVARRGGWSIALQSCTPYVPRNSPRTLPLRPPRRLPRLSRGPSVRATSFQRSASRRPSISEWVLLLAQVCIMISGPAACVRGLIPYHRPRPANSTALCCTGSFIPAAPRQRALAAGI